MLLLNTMKLKKCLKLMNKLQKWKSKTKDALLSSENNLRLVNNATDDLQ